MRGGNFCKDKFPKTRKLPQHENFQVYSNTYSLSLHPGEYNIEHLRESGLGRCLVNQVLTGDVRYASITITYSLSLHPGEYDIEHLSERRLGRRLIHQVLTGEVDVVTCPHGL